jgi:threonine aldolase
MIKQKGRHAGQGQLLGVQFVALLRDDLYFEIARHANKLAGEIKQACLEKGCEFLTQSTTNQQFPILPDQVLHRLQGVTSILIGKN